VPSVDPVRENEGASLPLKEIDALERKLFRISWSSWQRDGQTTVATFLAPFHPDLRFTAFRAYTAALLSFMAKWRR
jgi:hypothetical protein